MEGIIDAEKEQKELSVQVKRQTEQLELYERIIIFIIEKCE